MGVSIRDEEQKNKNGDQLKKEKVGIKERELTSKLSELEKNIHLVTYLMRNMRNSKHSM